MRSFIILILFLTSLLAKEETCYSVALESVNATDSNRELLKTKEYPNGCHIFEIGKMLSVRCGCFETYQDVQKAFPSYRKITSKAVVVTTYKWRFHSLNEQTIVRHVKKKRKSKSKTKTTLKSELGMDELKLMFKIFIYSGDVNYAFKVASLASKKYPDSVFWLKNSIQSAMWTNHMAEAFQYKKKLYARTKESKLRDALIFESLKYKQYKGIEDLVLEKFYENPSEKNANLLQFVEYKLGEPQKVLDIFQKVYQKDNKRGYLLTNILKISMDMGDIKIAKNTVELIEKRGLYDKVNIFLVANFYYAQHDITKAFDALLHVKNQHMSDPLYYKALSDYGWYLHDLNTAAWASRYLVTHKKARIVDYERILQYYKEKEKGYTAKVAKEAYTRYHKEYFFFIYARSMLTLKKYDALSKTLKELQKENLLPDKNADFWIIKAKLANAYKDKKSALRYLKQALNLEPESLNIFKNVMWEYISMGFYQKAKESMLRYESKHQFGVQHMFLYASLYFQLHEIDRANYYLDQLEDHHANIINSIEYKYLAANIHNTQHREMLAMQEYDLLVSELEKQFKKENSSINKNFLMIYLSAQMYRTDSDTFEKILEQYKEYLTKNEYDNILYAFSNKIGSYEKSHLIYTQMHERALWIELSNALLENDYSSIEDILYSDLQRLPKENAAAAAKKDKQLSLAQTLSFEAMQQNRYRNDLYLSYLSLSKERDEVFEASTAYYERSPLRQNIFLLQNRFYLGKDFYLYAKFDSRKNSSMDNSLLFNINDKTEKFDIRLEKLWQNYKIDLHYGYKRALLNYMQYGILLDYTLTKNLHLHLNYEKAQDVEDSTYLYVGAKENMVRASMDYLFIKSWMLSALYQMSDFYSQDDISIGTKNYLRAAVSREFRRGYPDIGVGFFFDKGVYQENQTDSYGVLEKITHERMLLPDDFYNIGMEVRYGMQNTHGYTRVWRPYFLLSPYYNSFSKNFDIGLHLGYGGKVYRNDHLLFGLDYSQPTNGLDDKIYKLFINYEIFY